MIDTHTIRENIKHGVEYSAEDMLLLCDEIDRLRGEKQTPQGKTVRAEAFYAVDKDGYYKILGVCGDSVTQADLRIEVCNDAAFDDGPVAFGTLTATLPVPEEKEVVATVDTATTGETATFGGRG